MIYYITFLFAYTEHFSGVSLCHRKVLLQLWLLPISDADNEQGDVCILYDSFFFLVLKLPQPSEGSVAGKQTDHIGSTIWFYSA